MRHSVGAGHFHEGSLPPLSQPHHNIASQGLAGNVHALREIADRLDGKAIQHGQFDMEERIKLIAVVP
jgi:hypothetical protein